jgi:hypothetical protein
MGNQTTERERERERESYENITNKKNIQPVKKNINGSILINSCLVLYLSFHNLQEGNTIAAFWAANTRFTIKISKYYMLLYISYLICTNIVQRIDIAIPSGYHMW